MKARKQRGSTAVEFSFILMAYFAFLLGLLDFSRMLFTWNAANEATRWGARTAVVCAQGDAAVLRNMQGILPQLTAGNVQVNWFDGTGAISATCTASTCTGVEVVIQDLDYAWISPIGFTVTRMFDMPGFATYLPREIMGQDPDSDAVCN